MRNPRNVFISHIHEDDKKLGELKSLLQKNGMQMRDSSINSDKPNNAKSPDYIMNEIIGPRISWAGTMIVLISPGTKDSEWVDKEIKRAAREEKRIVGVCAYGDKGCDVPEAFNDYGDALVGWSGDSIVQAIENDEPKWCDPDGSQRTVPEIPRFSC